MGLPRDDRVVGRTTGAIRTLWVSDIFRAAIPGVVGLMPRRFHLAFIAFALTACSANRFMHPAVVPRSDERVSLGFPSDVLYVLDGRILPRGDSASVPSAVRDLDPAMIETIQVLKGASAKQAYGDAGSSGVVIIRTKASR